MLGQSGMEVSNYLSLIVLLLLHLFFISSVASECAPGLSTSGVTIPKGDIILEYGNDLEIFCVLNETKLKENNYTYDSSSLYFSYDNHSVRHEYVNVINETTIRLFIKKPPPMEKMIMCKQRTPNNNGTAVCLNYVAVGYKPLPVNNFSCISYNWESMNCTWEPSPNFVKTTYNISFQLKTSNSKMFACPNNSNLMNNYCVWKASSHPPYRMVYSHYYFTLIAKNAIGELSKQYDINHYAVVLPNKPENLTLIEATSSSLLISWAIPPALRGFPPGLQNKILYQSKYDPINYWEEIILPSGITFENYHYNITGLKYAHTLYDIRVMMRSAAADENFWSEPASTTLHTKATVPGTPPKTDIGSFETRNPVYFRDVFIYWQQIPRQMENGDNFEYKVIKVEEIIDSKEFERNITPSDVTKTYASFPKLSLNAHKFTIVSSNKEGYSRAASTIFIPARNASPPEPTQFTKTAHEHGVYELSWKIAPNVTSYTIFWCDNKQDRPYECKGFLNWTRVAVGKDVKGEFGFKNITLPIEKVYQFALSANTETSSSGMVWASCTLFPGQAIQKLKNVWINRIGATFIEVSWKLDCIRKIKGFQISYCPIRGPQDSSCKEPVQNMTIKGDVMTSLGNITGLKPYTTYMVYVSVISGKSTGLSDPLLNTTMEAAPDLPPYDLAVQGVTNTSINLTWKSPPSLNGVLRYYIVHCISNTSLDGRLLAVHPTTKTTNITISNLLSYESYSIQVQACTVACSPNSSSVTAQTTAGRPGRTDMPIVRVNGTAFKHLLHVKWMRPSYPGGPIAFYEVRLTISDGNKILDEQRYNATGLNLTIPNSECQRTDSPDFLVDVRAVNIGPDSSLLLGEWSVQAQGNCYLPDPSLGTSTILFLVVVAVLAATAITIAVVCTVRCLWLRCKAMQNISVKLPPQLELNIVFKDKGADISANSHICNPPLKSHNDMIDVPPPDQQLLLDKKDKDELMESSTEDCEEGNADRESSGCGSGHDSVSSSITAGTHITDSGTEADECKYKVNLASSGQRPATPDVFSDSPRRISDLRQRNTSLSGNGEGYSRLASAPTPTGYVTVPPNFTRGYVSHPNWSQCSPSKNYVAVGSPSPTSNMYSIVGLRPPDSAQPYKDFSGPSRDHITTDSNINVDQLAINPAAGI